MSLPSPRRLTEIGRSKIRSYNGDQKGIPYLKNAQLIDPNYVDAIVILASFVSRQSITSNDYSVALKYIGWASVVAPLSGRIAHFRGLFHRNMGRPDLALKEFVRASSLRPNWYRAAHDSADTALALGENAIAHIHIRRCRNLDPNQDDMRLADEELQRRNRSPKRQIIARFPDSIADLEDFPSAISKHLFDTLELPRVLTQFSQIFAAGSCFAANITKILNEQGYSSFSNNFGEMINSTLANRQYFAWLCAEAPFDQEISRLISEENRKKAQAALFASDIIILTVGVAPVFLDKTTGKLRLPTNEGVSIRRLLQECEFRTLSVLENVDNIKHILATIRQHRPTENIFITLSPVPMMATFEYTSAIIADCVSKSVLRVAVDEIMRQQPQGVHYWPAFEAVRWIGGYSGGAYGQDDGSARHVSAHAIQSITSEFINRIRVTS